MRISPYFQGHLDSWCGIYSIINASKLVNQNIRGEEAVKIFSKCMKHLENYKRLSKISTEGIDAGDIWKILNEKLANYSIQVERPFYRARKISKDDYFHLLREYFKCEKRSAIISIESKEWDHWTVARAVTAKSLLLCDSSDIKTVSISKCTFKRLTKRKPFLINPKDTFYVYQKDHQKLVIKTRKGV